MMEKPAGTGERMPGEQAILGGATVLLSLFPGGLLFAPAPLAALVLRHGIVGGILTAVLAGALVTFIGRSPLLAAQVLLTLALGVALGEALRESFGVKRTLAVGAAVVMVTTALLLYYFQRVTGMSLVDAMGEFWREMVKSAAGGDAAAQEAALEWLIAAMRATLPASVVVSSAGLAVLDYALARWLVQKLPGGQDAVPPLPPFARWRFPRAAAAVFAAGFVLELFLGDRLAGSLGTAIINVTLVLGVFVAVQGVAVAWHFLERLRLTKALRLLLLAVIYLHPLLRPVAMIFFIGIGVLDAWIDMRKLREVA